MSTFSIKITHDESPMNPFTEWDCEPPLLSIYDGYRNHYGTEWLASELLRSISDAKLSRKFKELEKEYPHIISEEDFMGKKEDYGYTRPEYMRDAIIWNADDEREALSIACKLSNTPYLSYTSIGYSQSDCSDVIIVLSPEFFKTTGANPKHAKEILEGTKELYDAWAWGDVYGFKLIEHKPLYREDGTLSDETEDDVIDSCYGFYGESGLESIKEHIPEEHRHLFEEAKNNIK